MSAGDAGTTTGGRALVVVDVAGYRSPDVVLVDVLSRISLIAGRLGAHVVVRGAGPDLERLLEFVGLLAVVPISIRASDSELRGEPEALEEPGVEEVMDVRDAPSPELQNLDRPGLPPSTRPTRFVLGEGG